MNKLLLTIISLIGSFSALSQSTTWYEIPSGTDKQLNVIEFASSSVGYIGGNDSTLLKTTDGGDSWSPINFSGVTFLSGGEHIVNLKFVSEDVGYMTVGPYSGTYKTTDGGLNWSPLTFAGNMCYNQGLYFFSEGNGAVGGSGCFQGEHIEMMTSGTLSAPTINTPSWDAQDIVLDIDFEGANFGLAVSPNRFLRTTDAGATWDTIPTGFPDIELTSIEIVDDTLAYAGFKDLSSNFGIMMTTDAGLTWSQDINIATFYYPDYNDVVESNFGHIYAVGGADGLNPTGLVFDKTDNGWWYYNVDQVLHSVATYSDSTVFAVGDSGYVVTNINPSTSSISESENSIEELIIYPNPVSEMLTITLPDGIQQSNIRVIIRNADGKEIRTLQNTKMIDVSDLSTGVYLLELHSQDTKYISRFIKN